MNVTLAIIAAGTCLLMLGLVPPLRKLAIERQWLDVPHGRKRHQSSVPFVGGWVIFAAFWIGFGTCLLVVPELYRELKPFLVPVFFAHLLVFLGGIVDDFSDLKARYKLLIQLTAACILFAGGLKIETIYVPFVGSYALAWPLSLTATILWVLLIINAMNIIDGLDGLAAGLSIIAAIGMLYTSMALKIPIVTAISVVLLGVMFGFLRYNYPTASVFMGDSGSQSIGFIFAVAAIYCPIKSYTVVAMFVPLLTLGVPLIELGLSFSRRLVTGKPIMRADLGHLFHRLQDWGIARTHTVAIFWGVAAALQIFVFTLFLFDRRIVFSILVLFMLIVAGWFLLLSRKEER